MSVSQRRVFWVGELSCLNLSARTLLSRDQSRSSAKQAFCLHLQDSSRGASFKWCLTLNFLCMLDRIRHLLLKMMLNITVLSSHSCSGNKGVLLFLKPPPRKTANSFCFFLGCLERELGHHLLRPPLWFFFFFLFEVWIGGGTALCDTVWTPTGQSWFLVQPFLLCHLS